MGKGGSRIYHRQYGITDTLRLMSFHPYVSKGQDKIMNMSFNEFKSV